ncbi:hypothetical protein FRC11_003754 [Ceratobasidium sp. 423]|nr:hypothetical protein FRC11_003754 [Ceratobasidium sp. 423]
MPDSLQDYTLTLSREPRKRGPPPARYAPALEEIEGRKQQHEKTKARWLLSEKIAARRHMPVTHERLKAGEIPFPMLLNLPLSNSSHADEDEAYGLWFCEVVMYRRGKDVYDEWVKGEYTLSQLEQLAFPGPVNIYSNYNPFTEPPSPLDLESADFPPPRGEKRKETDPPTTNRGETKYRKLQQLAYPTASVATSSAKSDKGKTKAKAPTSSSGAPTSTKPKPPVKTPTDGKGKGKVVGTSTIKGTGATQDHYGGKAIVVDDERGNMYPGITRGQSSGQPVESRFAKSVKSQQNKFAPANPSPLRNVAFGMGQDPQHSAPLHARGSGFDPLQPMDETTVWNGKLVREQHVPLHTQTSLSQPATTITRNTSKPAHRPSASQPVGGSQSREARASINTKSQHVPSATQPTKMPAVCPGPYAAKAAAGPSRHGVNKLVGPGRQVADHPTTVNVRTHIKSNSIQSTGTGHSHTSTNASFSGGNASVSGGNGRGGVDENPSKRARKRMRQSGNRHSSLEARQEEKRQRPPAPARRLRRVPSSDDETLDAPQPYSESDEEMPVSEDNQPSEEHTEEEDVYEIDPVTNARYRVLRPDLSKYPDLESPEVQSVANFPITIRPFLRMMHERGKVLAIAGGGGYFYRSTHPLDKTKSIMDIAYDSFLWALDHNAVRLKFDQRFLLALQPQIVSFRTHMIWQLIPIVIQEFGYIKFVEDHEDIRRNRETFEMWGNLKFIYKTNRIMSWFSAGVFEQGRLNADADARTFAEVMDIIEYMRLKKRKTLWNVRTEITDHCLDQVELEKRAAGFARRPAAMRDWSPDAKEIFQSRFDERFTADSMNPQNLKEEDLDLPRVEFDGSEIGVDYDEVDRFNREQQGIDEGGDDDDDGKVDDDGSSDNVEEPLEGPEDRSMPDEEMMDPADMGDGGPMY